MDVKDEAVGQDGEEGGEAFDGVDKGDGDFLCGGRGEDVTTDLEKGERQGGRYNVSSRVANTVFECWDCGSEGRELVGKVCEENTPGGDEGELY